MSESPDPDVCVTLPCDRPSERTVVGAFLRSAPDCAAAFGGVRLDDFYAPEHRRIMEVALGLRDAGLDHGFAAVTERLSAGGMLAAVGGASTVAALVGDRGDPVRAVEVVVGLGKLRRLLVATQEIAAAVLAGRPGPDHPSRW